MFLIESASLSFSVQIIIVNQQERNFPQKQTIQRRFQNPAKQLRLSVLRK